MSRKSRNLRKAAILIASLDPEQAEPLLARMSTRQAELIAAAIERLGEIDPDEQEEVLDEFFRIGPLMPDKQPAGLELDGRLPRRLALSSSGVETSREFATGAAAPFRFLREASVASLVPYLEREHPQTIAVVISHLDGQRAADILAGLPGDLQANVARRLVDLDETDPDVLRDVEHGLETWLSDEMRSHQRRAVGISTLNKILEAANPQTKQHLVSNLARHDRQLAGKLSVSEPPPIAFAELEQFDSGTLKEVLQRADRQLLILALAGASEEFAARVLELCPPAVARGLARAMHDLGPTRLGDVEAAQRALADLASELRAHGQIVPRPRRHLSLAV